MWLAESEQKSGTFQVQQWSKFLKDNTFLVTRYRAGNRIRVVLNGGGLSDHY